MLRQQEPLTRQLPLNLLKQRLHTLVWRGPLTDRPDVCLIWRQRGRRSDDWRAADEDAYIRANYATGDKWEMLEHLPRRSWNMIYHRALVFGPAAACTIRIAFPRTSPLTTSM